MQTGLYLESKIAHTLSDRGGTADRANRTVEGREEPIPGRIQLTPAESIELRSNERMMPTDEVGPGSIAEVDLGTRAHRNRPVSELAPQAVAIVQVALERAGMTSRGPASATLVVPGADPLTVSSGDLPPLVDVPAYTRRSA